MVITEALRDPDDRRTGQGPGAIRHDDDESTPPPHREESTSKKAPTFHDAEKEDYPPAN